MYVPSRFSETRIDVLHQLIHDRPLGMLVTLGADGLTANHLPFEIDPEPAPFGTLRGHVARANPVWQDLAADTEALVVFQGPQTYISPSWYATKKKTGKVVPTWNYAVVHAHGRLRVIQDTAWLRRLLQRLTHRHEAARRAPWSIDDAPKSYIAKQLKAIVGIEIPIARLTGKWKTSQNAKAEDRITVVKALKRQADPNATAMAELVRRCPRDAAGQE